MENKNQFWRSPIAKSWVHSDTVTTPELLFGYMLGPFGAMLSSGIFTSFLNKYFTDVLLLDTAFLSGLQLVSTLFVVAANLIVGQVIESTHCLAGKARPWILLSALTVSVGSVLMFVVPFQDTASKMLWVAIAYNLFYAVAVPIYSTANSTLVPLSTRDSAKRNALASASNIASLGVMGVGSMLFPILVSNVLKEDQSRWLLVMLAVALFSALTILLQYKFTRERVTEELQSRQDAETGAKTVSVARQLKAVTGEKQWWILMLFSLAFQWAGALKNGSMSYFCQWVVDSSPVGGDYGVAQTVLAVMGAVPMAAAALFVVPLANRFSKRLLVFAGMVLGAVGGGIAWFGGDNLAAVSVGIALKCLGSAPACYLALAMLSDVIDHIEFTSHIRTDGLTMSIYSALTVAATPVCSALFMAMLNASGYAAPTTETASALIQSSAVRSTISVSYILIETVAYVLCAALILFFTVEKQLPEEQAEIADRRDTQ